MVAAHVYWVQGYTLPLFITRESRRSRGAVATAPYSGKSSVVAAAREPPSVRHGLFYTINGYKTTEKRAFQVAQLGTLRKKNSWCSGSSQAPNGLLRIFRHANKSKFRAATTSLFCLKDSVCKCAICGYSYDVYPHTQTI